MYQIIIIGKIHYLFNIHKKLFFVYKYDRREYFVSQCYHINYNIFTCTNNISFQTLLNEYVPESMQIEHHA